jgi:hypothetical protein
VVNLKIEAGLADKISLLGYGDNSVVVQVEDLANANVFAQRKTLFGVNSLFYEQVKFRLELDKNYLPSKFDVIAYENNAPRITNPAPLNNEIFVSIQWAPN